MAVKRSFGILQVLVIVFAIGVLFASWVVFLRPYGTMGTIAANIGPFIGVLVALGIAFVAAASARKPLRPSNYPRIEHLRIAGKYQAAERFGEMGISPLHLGR